MTEHVLYALFFLLLCPWQKNYLRSGDIRQSSCSSTSQTSCGIPPKTTFIPLSSAQNLYTQYHLPADDLLDLSITYRFQQSHNNNEIAEFLFRYNPLSFIGELVPSTGNRPKSALIPEYFGLGSDTNVSLNLSPRLRNQIIDIQLSFQSDKAWLQVNMPLIKPQWQITTLPITNNTMVGTLPLQNEGEVYIYNIGQTAPTLTNTLPPCANTSTGAGYNTLPPVKTPTSFIFDGELVQDIQENIALNTPPVNGCYIVSELDASDFETTLCASGTTPASSIFTAADMNKNAADMSNSIYSIGGFIGEAELSPTNWILPIGQWETKYEGYLYQAPTTKTVGQSAEEIVPPNLESQGKFDLTGTATDASEGTSEGAVNTLQIIQPFVQRALSLEDALSGTYDFNQTLTRNYLNFPFLKNTTTSTWTISDIILWLGYDFCKTEKKHIGLYLHGVIPGGTEINQDWNTYTLNSVAGNGNHYQLGCGLSAHYVFCEKKRVSYVFRLNGYIDHVFASDQFRVFDLNNNSPMSRYSIVKALNYTGNQGDTSPDVFNDDYEFLNFDIIGNVNNATLKINNNIKSELIAEYSIQSEHYTTSIGYAFSGLSEEIVNEITIPQFQSNVKNDPGQTYYGYKGNTAISNLIITGVTTASAATPVGYIVNTTSNETVTTKNPILIKNCGDVTIGGDSGAYDYGETTGGESNGTEPVGTTEEDVFILPNLVNNTSALMNGQILNRIYGKFEYSWDAQYKPIIGVLGSYGLTSKTHFTAAYWDLGIYLGCSF